MSDVDLKKLRWKAEILSSMKKDEIGGPVLVLLDRLEAAEAERDRLDAHAKYLAEEGAKLSTECDELRQDAMRFRWLDEERETHVWNHAMADEEKAGVDDLRGAIDAAMSCKRGTT